MAKNLRKLVFKGHPLLARTDCAFGLDPADFYKTEAILKDSLGRSQAHLRSKSDTRLAELSSRHPCLRLPRPKRNRQEGSAKIGTIKREIPGLRLFQAVNGGLGTALTRGATTAVFWRYFGAGHCCIAAACIFNAANTE
jgi:hypothetical protein